MIITRRGVYVVQTLSLGGGTVGGGELASAMG